MKTYWDYTDKEQSEMTSEAVQSLLDVELMTKGVMKIEPPILREIESVEIPRESFFEVNNVFFKTIEQAEVFLKLMPYSSTYDYNVGYDWKHAEPFNTSIKQVQLYKHNGLLNLKSILVKNKESKEANEKALSDFNKAEKCMQEVYNGVWNDWHTKRELGASYKKVIDTFEEYKKMTNNDESLALSFLLKVHSEDKFNKAKEWFNLSSS